MPFNKSFLLAFVAIVGFVLVGSSFGQQIPNRIVSSENPNSQDMVEVRGYVLELISQLSDGENQEDIRDARSKLCEPLVRAGSAHGFRERYSLLLSEALLGVMENESALVRLNALVIVSKFDGGMGASLLAGGMSDESEGVRYWSAKSVVRTALRNTGAYSADARKMLVGALVEASAKEESSYVVEQIYRAMAGLGALEELGFELSGNLTRPLNELSMDRLQAERIGLQQVSRDVYFNYKKYSSSRIKQIAVLMAGYAQMVSNLTELDNDNGVGKSAVAFDIVKIAEQYFNFAVKELDGDGTVGPGLYLPLSVGKTSDFRINLTLWIGSEDTTGRLSEKFGIPFSELKLKDVESK